MTLDLRYLPELTGLLGQQDGVVLGSEIMPYLSRDTMRWQVASGRWQRPCRGVVVAQSGPLSDAQILRVTALWAGPGAVLAGLTAATLGGLRGFADTGPPAERPVCVLVPGSRVIRKPALSWPVTVHYSRLLDEEDVQPVRRPPRTRMARSLLDAAAWMGSDRGAQAVLAAGVQQRLVRVEDLGAVLARHRRLPRRALIRHTLADIGGGAQALSELDLIRLIRRHRLPEPDRQAPRRDADGRRRWLDAVWEAARLIVEVDGRHHQEADQYWADMNRDNGFTLDGYRVLRFPAFVVRYRPGYVAAQIRGALRRARPADAA